MNFLKKYDRAGLSRDAMEMERRGLQAGEWHLEDR